MATKRTARRRRYVPADRTLPAARARAADRRRSLTQLLERRPELRGLHTPADIVADAARWGA